MELKDGRPKDGAQRADKFRAEQRKLGRTRSDLWATKAEREAVKKLLAELRAKAT